LLTVLCVGCGGLPNTPLELFWALVVKIYKLGTCNYIGAGQLLTILAWHFWTFEILRNTWNFLLG
jgi:hypothetical protein